MGEPALLKLYHRLIDPNTDAEVVPDLFHIGGSWTVRALRPGYPGSTSLGDFSILLPPPRTDAHDRNRDQIDAILKSARAGIGLKVETSLARGGASPVLSGVITGMNLPLDGPWELRGYDTLYWLQQSQLFPGEEGSYVSNLYRAYEIASSFFGTREMQWDDDFTNWNGGANYPSNAGFSVANDPVFSKSGIHATSAATGIANSGTSWSKDVWGANFLLLQAAQVTAWGVAQGDQTAGAGTGPVPGLFILSDASGNNAVLVDFLMKQTGASSANWNIDVRIGSFVGGVYTQRALASNVFTNVPNYFPFELTCSIYTSEIPGPATRVAFKAFLNGKEAVTWNNPGDWTIPATGKVGVRYGSLGGTFSEAWFHRLQFQGRAGTFWGTPRFSPGLTYNGTFVTGSSGSQGLTHLDWIIAAAAHDGAELRRTAGRGARADVIDYGLSLGSDLSDRITFQERGNVQAQGTQVTTVAEAYASESRIASVPFGDSGGAVTWGPLGAAGDMVLTDPVSDVGLVGYEFLTRYGRAIAERKANPLVARQVTVVRDADLRRFNFGLGPRELDTVTVHLPTYGIQRQKSRVIGFTLTEGSPNATYYLDDFVGSANAPAQRILRALDYLTATYARR